MFTCPKCGVLISKKVLAKYLGGKGGETTSRRYGKSHYIALAKNMNAKRWNT